MTKKIILIFMAALCSVNSYSQTYRSCATNEVHEENLRKDPLLQQRMTSIESHTQLFEQTGANNRAMAITIPVVVHIIYNTASQNISNLQIQSQIDVLNEDFRKLNADVSSVPSVWQSITADAQIEFCLAKRDPMGNATTGITRTYTNLTSFSTNNDMKFTSSGGKDAWDRNQYMNIWICNLNGSVAGYAQFPGGTAATDGMVIHYSTFGRVGTLMNGYNKGRVTTHEVGHWLNLRHIWGDASCGNDYVADTPTQFAANYGCPGYPYVTCSNGPHGDMSMNYMDYTFDACKYMFTQGQSSRMNAVLAPGGHRYSLTSSLGCVPPGGTSTCNTPTGLTASVGSTTATLSWSSTGASSYNVRCKSTSSSTWINYTTSQTSHLVSGLTAGVTYEFQVQSNCSSSISNFSSSATFIITVPICNIPTGLLINTINTSYVTVSWTGNGSVSYVVRYKPLTSGTWNSYSTSLTSMSISGLTAGINYEVQVQGVCSSSSSAFSSSVNFIIPVSCNVPSGLVISNISPSSATLSWNSTGAVSYNVKYKPTSAGTWTNLNTSQNNVFISGLLSGTAYEYQVQSVCNSVSSIYSETATFTTTALVCNIPSGLSSSNITTSTAVLTWNNTGANSYNLRYKVLSGSTWSYLGTSQLSISMGGLQAGTTYEFQVQSLCASSSSNYSSSATFNTLNLVCNVPSGLVASNITGTSAQLNWSTTGAGSYVVRYKNTSSSSWINSSTSQTYIVVSGLVAGNNYAFEVQSICSASSSSFSNSVFFSTVAPTCNIPSGLSVTNISSTSAQLNWSYSGASSYNVRYKNTASTNWANLSTTLTSLSISGLVEGNNYEFQVQGNCSSSLSAFSNSVNFSTPSACSIPVNLATSNITASSATLSWNTTGAVSYTVRYKSLFATNWNNVTTSQTSLGVSGLTSGTTYEFQVQSNCSSTSSNYSLSMNFTTVVTIISTCSTPSGLSANNITTTTATLQWNPTTATTYYVRYKAISVSTWSNIIATQTTVNVGGLAQGSTYEFQVQGVCGTTYSSYSSSFNFTTSSPMCIIPSGITVSSITSTSAVVAWTSTGASSYTFRYKPTTSSIWTSFNSLQTSVFLSGLTGGIAYEFQVQSICGSTLSAFSNSSSFNTLVAACATPGGLTISNITNTTANLSWNSTGAGSYYVRYKAISNVVWSNIITSQLNISVGGLQTGTSYEWQVQSVCATTSSSYSESSVFTTTAPFCTTPAGLMASNITQTTGNLSWSATGASSYYVRYKPVTSFVWNSLITSQTSVNLGGLIQGTQYEFQVQSSCGATSSSYSSSISFTTLSSFCTVPSGLMVGSITFSSANLMWNSTGANSYNIKYKPLFSSVWVNLGTTQTSINISGLSANTTYEFQVQSNCGNSLSSFSVSSTFTTFSSLPTNAVTVGTGNSVNNLPYGTAFLDEKVQFFITKAELDAAGFNAINNRIISMSFYVTTASSQVMNNFTIKIAHLSTGSFSNNYFINTFSGTTVFTGNVTATPNSWNKHIFSSPFIYNGVSSLLIEICFDNSSGSTNSMVKYTPTQSPTVLYNFQNIVNSDICNTSVGTLSYNRPNTMLEFNGSDNRISAPDIIDIREKSEIILYPNPASTGVSLEFVLNKDEKKCIIEIYSITGTQVYAKEVNGVEGENKIDLQFNSDAISMQAGIYFVKLISPNRELVSKLIIK